MRKKSLLSLVACLVLLLSVGTTSALADVRFITIASGPVGGEWYILGGVLGELFKEVMPGVKVTVTTGGALANPTTIEKGRADIGTTQDQLLLEACKGTGAFEEEGPHQNLAALAYLGDIYMSFFLVREESPIKSIDEIREKKIPIKILTSPPGSSPSKAAERMLSEYGITPENLKEWGGRITYVSYSEASSLLRDGHADAWCGPIVPAIIEMTVSRKMRLLPIKESVLAAVNEKYKYGRVTVPKGAYYFVPEDTPIMSESMALIVRKDLPEDVVYKITKVICEHPDRVRGTGKSHEAFSPENAWRLVGAPLHPGAERYYRENGWMK